MFRGGASGYLERIVCGRDDDLLRVEASSGEDRYGFDGNGAKDLSCTCIPAEKGTRKICLDLSEEERDIRSPITLFHCKSVHQHNVKNCELSRTNAFLKREQPRHFRAVLKQFRELHGNDSKNGIILPNPVRDAVSPMSTSYQWE